MRIIHSGLMAVALLSLAGAAAAQASGGPEAKAGAKGINVELVKRVPELGHVAAVRSTRDDDF